jgi:hypothetical protein
MEKQNKKGIKSKMILERANTKPNVEFHYTPEELVKYCLSLLSFGKEYIVLDVGSGKNMVWYNNINVVNKDFCEIELGKDFFEYKEKVDWCIGNPPFKFLWKMMEKSFDMSNKGVAFLMAIDGINRFTPKRLEYIKSKGFYINKIAIVNCKKWFGRYFFVIFTKEPNTFFEWSLLNYGDTELNLKEAPSIPPNPKGIGYPA